MRSTEPVQEGIGYQPPTSGDLRLLTYLWHCPGWHSVRHLAQHTTMSNRGVIDSLRRCLRNRWLTRYRSLTEDGIEEIPKVLLHTPEAHLHLLRTWTAENSLGLRALLVALHARAEYAQEITSADVARWLGVNRNTAVQILRRWTENPQTFFTVRLGRSTWRLVNPLVEGGSDADYCGSAHDQAVLDRNARLQAEIEEHAAARLRWQHAQFGPPSLIEQTVEMFANYQHVDEVWRRNPFPVAA